MAKKAEKKAGARDIGIPISNPPVESCADARCPYHGHLPIRGRVFEGTVVSDLAAGTAIVKWEFLRKIQKYQRYMRKSSKVAAHNPPCIRARTGDIVKVAECRPLSKTKHFVVIERLPKV